MLHTFEDMEAWLFDFFNTFQLCFVVTNMRNHRGHCPLVTVRHTSWSSQHLSNSPFCQYLFAVTQVSEKHIVLDRSQGMWYHWHFCVFLFQDTIVRCYNGICMPIYETLIAKGNRSKWLPFPVNFKISIMQWYLLFWLEQIISDSLIQFLIFGILTNGHSVFQATLVLFLPYLDFKWYYWQNNSQCLN